MADPHVITALVKKRSELSGDLIKLDKQRRVIKACISSVGATLKEFAYSGEPSAIAPRVCYEWLFKRGELGRMVADVLRTAGRELSNLDIALMVVARKQWDAGNQDLLNRVAESVKPVARRLRARSAGRGSVGR
jgi:hypothetical protein